MGPTLSSRLPVAPKSPLHNQPSIKTAYRYSPLPPEDGAVRLLRLIPSKDGAVGIKCELFNYSPEPDTDIHLYDALSYVWGDSKKVQPISIDDHDYNVTENLHAALLHLRDRYFERIIWIDAICINQTDEQEKGRQIQAMAKIYGQANRVIVWLGAAADESGQTLQCIRATAGEGKPTRASYSRTSQESFLKLLERPWFKRIWVLQEVAAARHVLIKCGTAEIDGHAFCLGVDLLMDLYGTRPDLQGLIRSVTYLIRGSIFRPTYQYAINTLGKSSLDICTLSELIDMYHNHEATEHRDKVYALLGMSSDDVGAAGLSPNYSLPWKELLRRLVRLVLHENVSVDTWNDKEVAAIKNKGCILGTLSVESGFSRDYAQKVDVVFKSTSEQPEHVGEWSARWTLQASAKPVQDGDLVCLLRGASSPTIIRPYKDCFGIIVIAATPPETIQLGGRDTEWSQFQQLVKGFDRDFLLVWDWEATTWESHCEETYHTLIEKSEPVSESPSTEMEMCLDRATRIWDVGLILGDSGDFEKAEGRIREAIEGYETAFGTEHMCMQKILQGLTPLSWAARNGHSTILRLLLAKDGVNADLKDNAFGRTPLSWAAGNGHEAAVNLLLETCNVDIDAGDEYGRTPLWWAVKNGHEGIFRTLVEKGNASIDSKDCYGITPLLQAAESGHEIIVHLLLDMGGVNINATDNYRRTPLWWAVQYGWVNIFRLMREKGNVDLFAKDCYGTTLHLLAAENGQEEIVRMLLDADRRNVSARNIRGDAMLRRAVRNGHVGVARLLLETIIVNPDLKDLYGRTPLLEAADDGQEWYVQLLLATGNVDVNTEDIKGRTPLGCAARNGHVGVVSLLLKKSNVQPDLKNCYGRTALLQAAENGWEEAIELLLDVDSVDVNAKDNENRTALWWAARNGHDRVVGLLLKICYIDIDGTDTNGQTPLSQAAENGYEIVVQMLIDAGNININAKDVYGRTPLWWAVRNGHKRVVKLLIEADNVDVDTQDAKYRQTPLLRAAITGHKGIAKLLLENTKVDADARDKFGRTSLWWAARNGHETIVKLLLEKSDVDISAKDLEFGKSPLWWARENDHDEITKLLQFHRGFS